MNTKRTTLHLFSYQIHLKADPGLIFGEAITRYGLKSGAAESALEKKNEIFEKAIWGLPFLIGPRRRVGTGKIILKKNQASEAGRFLLKIGCEKRANMPDENLQDKELSYFPYVYAFFDNRPDKQVLAVQHNQQVFFDPHVVADILQKSANMGLSEVNLECSILPQFEEKEFWNFVSSHKKKIKRLQFLVVAPNLPRISASIPEELNELQKSIHSQSAKIDFQSLKDSHLTVERDNEAIAGLAKAAAAGGGEIKAVLKGFKKLVNMKKGTKEISIDELQVDGPPEAVLKTISDVVDKIE